MGDREEVVSTGCLKPYRMTNMVSAQARGHSQLPRSVGQSGLPPHCPPGPACTVYTPSTTSWWECGVTWLTALLAPSREWVRWQPGPGPGSSPPSPWPGSSIPSPWPGSFIPSPGPGSGPGPALGSSTPSPWPGSSTPSPGPGSSPPSPGPGSSTPSPGPASVYICTWHHCQWAALNIRSVSTWTLGCPSVG